MENSITEMGKEYPFEPMDKRYKLIIFSESNGSKSSTCKGFQSEKHLSDFLNTELTEFGRKDEGIYSFETWEEVIDVRLRFRSVLS